MKLNNDTAIITYKCISHGKEALLCPACHVHRLNDTIFKNGYFSDYAEFLFNSCAYVFPKHSNCFIFNF